MEHYHISRGASPLPHQKNPEPAARFHVNSCRILATFSRWRSHALALVCVMVLVAACAVGCQRQGGVAAHTLQKTDGSVPAVAAEHGFTSLDLALVTTADAGSAKLPVMNQREWALIRDPDSRTPETAVAAARPAERAGVPEAGGDFGHSVEKVIVQSKAEQAAKNVASAIAPLHEATEALERAKARADTLDAKTWASVLYEQAVAAEEKALAQSADPQALELFVEAERLYTLAASQANEDGRQAVASARQHSEQAASSCRDSDAKRYARSLLMAADRLAAGAKKAESDYTQAASMYRQAAAKYNQALEATRLAASPRSDTPVAQATGPESTPEFSDALQVYHIPPQLSDQSLEAKTESQREQIPEQPLPRHFASVASDASPNVPERIDPGTMTPPPDNTDTAPLPGPTQAADETAVEPFPGAQADLTASAEESRPGADLNDGPRQKMADLGFGVTIEFVRVPPGQFEMGSPTGPTERDTDEGPVHRVKVARSFYMGKFEVTQQQYRAVTGRMPALFKGAELPVENVSWQEAVEFCQTLSRREGRTYRLPTEAEWEYACRAGSSGRFAFGESYSELSKYAWHAGNSGGTTQVAGSKTPNAFGLYDMHGNLWEWCSDWYAPDYYGNSPVVDPRGPERGKYRVLRGGAWSFAPAKCRSSIRGWGLPQSRASHVGFRIVLDLQD
jgi:formylglycine-generating enzyme required for sulfatase activity